MTTYPTTPADLSHLRDHLGCTFLSIGERGSSAAVTSESIESSLVAPGDDPAQVLGAVVSYLAATGSPKVEIQICETHPAYPMLRSIGWGIKFSDTLMASPGANVPDHTRITFNGDFLYIDPPGRE